MRKQLWTAVALAIFCGLCGPVGCTVTDRVAEDGSHQRSISVGGAGPVLQYDTFEPADLEEFARDLAESEFAYRSAHEVEQSRGLRFVYVRLDPEADQYEFAKRVALSGFEREFPAATSLTISVLGGKELGLLAVRIEREDLDRLRATSGDSGVRFCGASTVLLDVEGRCRAP